MKLTLNNRRGSCEGKVGFDSPALAISVITRHRKQKKTRVAYRCKVCGLYHLGSKALKRMDER